jgi:hypothetical protein
MQVYLGNTPMDYRGIQLGNNNISTVVLGDGFINNSIVRTFVSASGITNGVQISALNYLVASLLDNNLWNKFYCIYPLVGGSADTCKYNLVSPSDYILDYVPDASGPTANQWNFGSGIQLTGFRASDARAETGFSPPAQENWTTNSSIGVYSTTSAASGYDIGNGTGANQSGLIVRFTPNDNFYAGLPIGATGGQVLNTDGKGYYVASRSGSLLHGFKNTTTLINSASYVYPPPSSFGFNLLNDGGPIPSSPSERNLAFVWFGQYVTKAESDTIYGIVQQYETILGRQV